MSTIIHVDDVGTDIELEVVDDDDEVVNLASAAVIKFRFRKPDGSVFVRDGELLTDGLDGMLLYTTVEGDIDVVGMWTVQGYVETSDGKFSTEKTRIPVRSILSE